MVNGVSGSVWLVTIRVNAYSRTLAQCININAVAAEESLVGLLQIICIRVQSIESKTKWQLQRLL